jgi:hypothetical protein
MYVYICVRAHVCNYICARGSRVWVAYCTCRGNRYGCEFNIKPVDMGLKTLYPQVSNLLPFLVISEELVCNYAHALRRHINIFDDV